MMSRILTVTNLHRVLGIYPTVDQALSRPGHQTKEER
jgi:hypothetical protein